MRPDGKFIQVLMRAQLQSLLVTGVTDKRYRSREGLAGQCRGLLAEPRKGGQGLLTGRATSAVLHGGILSASTGALLTSFPGDPFLRNQVHTVCSHSSRAAVHGDRGLCSKDVELFCPTRNRALGRLSGSACHLGAQRKDSCSPTAQEHPNYTASCGLFGM